MSVVLDSSAVLALLWNEAGSNLVMARLGGAIVSAVNVAEIYAKCAERSQDVEAARRVLQNMPLEIRGFDEPQALLSGKLRVLTRPFGLSLGDRACLAMAILEKRPVMTADRTWQKLDLGVEIIAIR